MNSYINGIPFPPAKVILMDITKETSDTGVQYNSARQIRDISPHPQTKQRCVSLRVLMEVSRCDGWK